MNSNCCCGFVSKNTECETAQVQRADSEQKPLILQHSLRIIRLALPGVMLVILPKCPICLGEFYCDRNGVSLSITTAAYVRLSLIILCMVSLLYLVIKRLFGL